MKKILAIVLAMLMILSVSFVCAEVDNITDETDNTSVDDEVDNTTGDDPGITPDSPLWGLDRAMERISLALTFNKAAKAKKGLAHALERLGEVQAMIAEKKMNHAAKAQNAHKKIMDNVEQELDELGNGDAEGELKEVLEIENQMQEHAVMIQTIQNAKLKMKGLSEEQEDELEDIVSGLDTSGKKFQLEVMNKKDKTKIKIKAMRGMDDEQVNELEEQIRSSVGNGEVKVIGKGRMNQVPDEVDNTSDESEEEFEAQGNGNSNKPENMDKPDINKGKSKNK